MRRAIASSFILPLLFSCAKSSAILLNNFVSGVGEINNFLTSNKLSIECDKPYDFEIDLAKYTYIYDDPYNLPNHLIFTNDKIAPKTQEIEPIEVQPTETIVKIDNKELTNTTDEELKEPGTFIIFKEGVVFKFFKNTDIHKSKISIRLKCDVSIKLAYANYCNGEVVN